MMILGTGEVSVNSLRDRRTTASGEMISIMVRVC